ncbi:MAG: helix-turn-helix domain-containing protein [Deltaproteobacteria bacterium]|nr:helix-turn-helix domain-containing protein [Deltaproteobacteria bacterium]MBI4796409.1 helix-turn-helix domain-containing protein [Deltaproteobacteria bacterium]
MGTDGSDVRYINEKEVSRITGIPLQTLRNFRCQGRGIGYSKFGRSVRYRLQDVLAFMESHRIEVNNL